MTYALVRNEPTVHKMSCSCGWEQTRPHSVAGEHRAQLPCHQVRSCVVPITNASISWPPLAHMLWNICYQKAMD